ncbi:peptidoglycan-binding domain-containing protein [Streptomyces jeddahensis]|uniref:N-acetylmuramoyl-L-alanine amidase CwlH n=1 Tax=Streptomyces jeddahensis TaxID=1716141 RepID=A0A177HZM7_9ACTN|nr:peptidoglycan-binding protein [Streptomyces jeddahensis]OAH16301.1 N-acetylmuramoyl-L-alanine amidase CwlH precursor [Streptomyces jeddahensis]
MNKWTMRGTAALTTAILAAGLTACGGGDETAAQNKPSAQAVGPAPSPGQDEIRTNPGSTTIGQGAQGFHVRCVQWGANAYVDPNVTVDGVYGPKTTKAVKRYQSSRSLSADGIVGPKTGARLKDDITNTRRQLVRMGEPEAARPYSNWLKNCSSQIPG